MCVFVAQACAEFTANAVSRVHHRLSVISHANDLDCWLNCGHAMIAIKLLGNMVSDIVGTFKVWIRKCRLFIFGLTQVAMIGDAMRALKKFDCLSP